MSRRIAHTLFALSIVVATSNQAFAQARTWTDVTGRSMRAEFLRLEGTDVKFRKDGAEVSVPIHRLSPDDRDLIVELAKGPNTPSTSSDPPSGNRSSGSDDESAESTADRKLDPPQLRTWTDKQGKTARAKFVRVHENNVILNRGGRVNNLPFASLSEPDQQYVRDLLTERGEQDKIPIITQSNTGSGGTSPFDPATGDNAGSPAGPAGGGFGFGFGFASGSGPGFGPSGPFSGSGFPGNQLPGGLGLPSGAPSGFPGGLPSGPPSGFPSGSPSGFPSGFPGGAPTGPPSGFPGGFPSGSPGGLPTGPSSGFPSGFPSAGPGDPSGFSGSTKIPSGPSSGFPTAGPGSTGFVGTGGFPGGRIENNRARMTNRGGMMGGLGMGGSGLGGSGLGGTSLPSSAPPGFGGADGPARPPGGPGLPLADYSLGECSRCKATFTAEESNGKTHCPTCGIAWENQGGTPGTVDMSAAHATSTAIEVHGRTAVYLVRAGIGLIVLLCGGGTVWASRKFK